MINKQVKSSERERERESNSYTITRATPIDLKTIDSEVALLSGRATQTPISMEALWNEVQNLKKTNLKIKEINQSFNSNSSIQTVLTLSTTQTKIYSCIDVVIKGENHDLKIFGITGNFSKAVYHNGIWGGGKPYVVLERVGNTLTIKYFAPISGIELKLNGFIIY